ncbi:hypothetical protein GQ53DRAFT_166575 [Thozetella sp. PMI_491]|nr:hypothetical protein GQ53DRAFT_166575 [Thozetella sp. PMI_491]
MPQTTRARRSAGKVLDIYQCSPWTIWLASNRPLAEHSRARRVTTKSKPRRQRARGQTSSRPVVEIRLRVKAWCVWGRLDHKVNNPGAQRRPLTRSRTIDRGGTDIGIHQAASTASQYGGLGAGNTRTRERDGMGVTEGAAWDTTLPSRRFGWTNGAAWGEGPFFQLCIFFLLPACFFLLHLPHLSSLSLHQSRFRDGTDAGRVRHRASHELIICMADGGRWARERRLHGGTARERASSLGNGFPRRERDSSKRGKGMAP